MVGTKGRSFIGRAALAAGAAAMSSFAGKKKATSSSSRSKARTGRQGRTTTRPRRNGETDNQTHEYQRESVVRGRKPRENLKQAWKLLNANKSSTIFRVQSYGTFAGTSGAVTLPNTSTTATTGTLRAPCVLYDLTAVLNSVNGVISSPTNVWSPQFSDPTAAGTLSWNQGTNIAIENVDTPSTNQQASVPLGSSYLDWIQAKMLFYAPTALPVRVEVQVVRFKDTRLVPGEVGIFPTAFWQGILKRFMYNPLEAGDPKYNKYLNVLYDKSFILTPKETTEAVNTLMRELNVFMRTNRRCTYDWADSDPMAMLSQEQQINRDANLQMTVHPRARTFLMIRAQAGNGTAYSPTIHPSFDIVIRTKHTQFTT